MSSSRQLYLFGRPLFQEDEQTIELTFRKGQALFAYLGAIGKEQGLDTLATLLWPEYSQTRARANLRRTIYAINQAGLGSWIDAGSDRIRLSTTLPIEIDFVNFMKLVEQWRDHTHEPAAQFNYSEDAVQATAYTTS